MAECICGGRSSTSLAALCIAALASSSVYGLLAPVFPDEARAKGLSEPAMGVIFASFAATVFVASPIVGKAVIPRFGRRLVLLSGLTTLALSTFCFALVPKVVGSPYVFSAICIAIRISQGVGAAMTETASYALCTSLFRDDLTAAMGAIEIAVGVGWMLGPVFGGFLVELGGSFSVPFIVVAFWVLLMTALVSCVIPNADAEYDSDNDDKGDDLEETQDDTPKHARLHGEVSVSQVLTRPTVVIMLGVATLANSSYSFFEPTLQDHIKPLTRSSGAVGGLFFACSAFYAGSTAFVGTLAKEPLPEKLHLAVLNSDSHSHSFSQRRLASFHSSSVSSTTSTAQSRQIIKPIGPMPVILIGVSCIALGFLLVGPSQLFGRVVPSSIALTGVAMSVIGIGQCAAMLPLLDVMLRDTTALGPHAADTLSGLLNSSYALGEMMGPLLGSNLVALYGFGWATTIWASAILVYLALLVYTALFVGSDADRNPSSLEDPGPLLSDENLQGTYSTFREQ